jgi:hypothetical protein
MNFAVGAPKWLAAISFAVYSTIGASAAVADSGEVGGEIFSCILQGVKPTDLGTTQQDLFTTQDSGEFVMPRDGDIPDCMGTPVGQDPDNDDGPPPGEELVGPPEPINCGKNQQQAFLQGRQFVDEAKQVLMHARQYIPEDCLTEISTATTILGQNMAGGAFGATRSNTGNSFSTRDQALSFGLAPTENGTGDQVVTVSSQSPSMLGDMYLWIDVSAFRAEATGARNYDANSLQFGADFAVSPNWVVGLSLGVSDLGADFAGGTTDGDALFLQPYVGYRSGPWSADLSIIVAQIDYNTTVGGGGVAESDMLAVNLQIAREMATANGAMLTPSLSIQVGDEDYTGISGTLAGSDGNFGWTEVSLGARYGFALGGLNQAYIGAYADYMSSDSPTSALLTTPFDVDGWSSRVEFGGSMSLNDRTTLSAGIQSGGFGSDLTFNSGNLELQIRF